MMFDFQYSQEYLAGLCTSLEEKAKAADEVCALTDIEAHYILWKSQEVEKKGLFRVTCIIYRHW